MFNGIHILDVYSAIIGTIAFVVAIIDLIIDHKDLKQDKPKE